MAWGKKPFFSPTAEQAVTWMGSVFHSFGCPGSAAFGVDVLLAGAEGGWGGVFCGPDDAAPFLDVFNSSSAEEHIHPSPPPPRWLPALSLTATPDTLHVLQIHVQLACDWSLKWSQATWVCWTCLAVHDFFSPSFQALPSSPYINKFVPSLLLCRRCHAPPFPSECETFCHPVSFSRSSSPPSRSFILPVLSGAAVDLRWCLRLGRVNVEAFSPLSQMAGAAAAEITDIFSFLFESGGDQSPNIHSFALFLLFLNLLFKLRSVLLAWQPNSPGGPALQTSTN